MNKRSLKRYGMTMFTAMMAAVLLFAGGFASPVSADLPDPTKKASLTVHKYASVTPSTTPGDGLALAQTDADALGKPLEGAKFSLSYITDQAGVTSTTDPATVATNAAVSELTTDANGEVKWTDLTQGYYVLKETSAPAGYTASAPTIITLPMGITADGSGFNYDVHVYPKNVSDAGLTKTTDSEGFYEEGDTVSWTIEGALDVTPALLAVAAPATPAVAADYGTITATDILDPRLIYTAKTAKLSLIGGSTGAVALTVDTDYTETYTPGVAGADGTIVWTLTPAGVMKVISSGSTGIKVEVDTKLGDVTGTSGQITNDATLDQAPPENDTTDVVDPDPEVIDPGVKPEIKLAGVEILKVDSLDQTQKLDGAQFKISDSEANAAAGKFLTTEGAYKTTAELVAPEKHVETTTGDNPETVEVEKGWGYIAGVAVSDTAPTDYYLVETKVPANPDATSDLQYIMKQSAIKVTVPSTGNGTATVLNQLEGNPPIPGEKPTFVLPTTGGMGTVLFTVIGLALMIFAAILIKRNKKENASA